MLRNSLIPSSIDSARNNTSFYYCVDTLFPSLNSILNMPDSCLSSLSPLSRSCLSVCFFFYMRVGELLRLLVSDCISPDRVVVRSLKRSNPYVIFLPGLSSRLACAGDLPSSTRLFPSSYMRLYRDCLRVGISFRDSGSSNSHVLHCARYIFARQVSPLLDDSGVAAVLRHRSLSSGLFYTQKKE